MAAGSWSQRRFVIVSGLSSRELVAKAEEDILCLNSMISEINSYACRRPLSCDYHIE